MDVDEPSDRQLQTADRDSCSDYFSSPSCAKSETDWPCLSNVSRENNQHSGGSSDSGIETDTDCFSDDRLSCLCLSGKKAETELKCPFCPIVTSSEQLLVDHIQATHCELLRAACKTCNQLFPMDNIEKHVKRCKGNYICSICQATFAQHSYLQRHISRTHSQTIGTACDICGLILSSNHSLKQHKQRRHLHEGEYPYKCSICDMRFLTKTQMHVHLDSQHAMTELLSEPKPYNCFKCGRLFLFSNSLEEHARQHVLREQKKKTIPCKFCEKKFGYPSELYRHLSCHLGPESRVFRCTLCFERFSREYLLSEHFLQHIDPGSFTCPQCNRSYSTLGYLRRHILKHIRECQLASQKPLLTASLSEMLDGSHCAEVPEDFMDICSSSGLQDMDGLACYLNDAVSGATLDFDLLDELSNEEVGEDDKDLQLFQQPPL